MSDTPRQRNAPLPNTDTEGMRSLMDSLSATLAALQTSSTTPAAPDMQEITATIEQLRGDISRHGEEDAKILEAEKKQLQNALPKEIIKSMRDPVRQKIREEVARQAQSQIEKSINEFLPVSLDKQVSDNEMLLKEVDTALENSKARDINTSMNWNDALARVRKRDGSESSLYPADLMSLKAYDSNVLGQLLRDFDLDLDKDMVINMNTFMAHVGVRREHFFEIIP